MISRCPSCGAQVADDAQQCPHCYWDFEKFKRVPPPGQPVLPPPPPAKASSEPEPNPVPEPELILPPVPAPEPAPAPPPSLPSFPAKPTPATPARADGGGLSLPQFGKLDHVQPLGPVSGLPPAPRPAAPAEPEKKAPSPPERSAGAVPPPIPKASGFVPRLPAASPSPEKKSPGPAKDPPGPKAEPPLTMVHSGGGWGSAPMPKPAAAKPASGRQVPAKPGSARSPLLNRATAGVVLAGISFVVVTHFALRPDVKEGGRSASPVFAKGQSPPISLPMPAPPVPRPAEPAAAIQPAAAPSTAAAVGLAAVTAAAAPAVPAAASGAEPAKAEPEKAPAPRPAPKPKPGPAPRPKEAGPSWTFQGKVYDLISLRPVYGAVLDFKNPSGEAAGQASTDEDGSYEVSLEPLSNAGYSLLVKHSDYQEKYIDEINPPFREVSLEERRLLVRMAARARPWVGKATLTVRRDFVMIPKE